MTMCANMRLGILKAYPIVNIGDNSKQRVEEAIHGGKIILPISIFRRVFRFNQSVMIFKLINEKLEKHVFCGVYTFDGEEPKVLAPLWVMKQLQIEIEDNVLIEYLTTSLAKGVFAKFEPLSKAFLDLKNPKEVLEHCMRCFVCISKNDCISICFEGRVYELRICETQPNDTIDIIDCDLEVDFAEMKGQEMELPEDNDLDKLQSKNTNNSFEAFSGTGRRINGINDQNLNSGSNNQQNNPNPNQSDNKFSKTERRKGIPDYGYKIGLILFKRRKKDLIRNEGLKAKDNQKRQSNGYIKGLNESIDKSLQNRKCGPNTRSQTLDKSKENESKNLKQNSKTKKILKKSCNKDKQNPNNNTKK